MKVLLALAALVAAGCAVGTADGLYPRIHASLERQAPLQDAQAVRELVERWGITYPVGVP